MSYLHNFFQCQPSRSPQIDSISAENTAHNAEASANRRVCLNNGDMKWNSDRISLCDSRLHDHVCVWRDIAADRIIKQSVSGSCNLKRSSSPALPPQLISHLISTKIRLEKQRTAAFPRMCVHVRVAIHQLHQYLHANACVCLLQAVFFLFVLFSFISHTQGKPSPHYQILTLSLPRSALFALFGSHLTNGDVRPYIQLSKMTYRFLLSHFSFRSLLNLFTCYSGVSLLDRGISHFTVLWDTECAQT